MIDALVFDSDGVIVDTETPDFQTWQDAYRSLGVELDRSLWEGIIGGGASRFDPGRHLAELVGPETGLEDLLRERRHRYLELVEASPLLPGVSEYIKESKGLRLKLGVASSSTRAWVEGHLSRRDLLGCFDSVTCRDDVSEVKPSPELYVTAVARLGAGPERSLAIEDSANGLAAAKGAGMFCVVVPNQMTVSMPLDRADVRLQALSDMPLSSLISALDGKDPVQQAPEGG